MHPLNIAIRYSRSQPSKRYLELLEQYRLLHNEGEKNLGLSSAETYPGISLLPHINRIKQLIDDTSSLTVLDYASGKGKQYESKIVKDLATGQLETIVDYWDVEEVFCYDPGFSLYNQLPNQKFDGVISTDMFEHCPEEDLPWVIDEIFSFANKFVFANIACFPAKHHLPNGENAHCTLKPLPWWEELLKKISADYPGIRWEAYVTSLIPNTNQAVEERIGNF